MCDQISIFDFIEQDADFTIMPLAEIAERVGIGIGIKFIKDERYDDIYVAFYKHKMRLSLSINNYNMQNRNDPYISASWEIMLSEGGGRPCDSIEEAIIFFETAIKRYDAR